MKITVSPVEVNERIDDFLKRNNTTREEVEKVLLAAGTSLETFRAQQVAFAGLAEGAGTGLRRRSRGAACRDRRRHAPRRRRRQQAALSRFPKSSWAWTVPRTKPASKAEIESIEKQIRAGGSFRNLARQYQPQPVRGALGGDMGWVYDGQLDPELNSVVASWKLASCHPPFAARAAGILWACRNARSRSAPTSRRRRRPRPDRRARCRWRACPAAAAGRRQDAIDNTMKISMQIRQATALRHAGKRFRDPVLKGGVFMTCWSRCP